MNHFERYNELLNMIREIKFKLMVIDSKLIGLKAVTFSDTPKVTNHEDHRLDYIADKDELLKKLDVLEEEKEELYKKHLKEISKVGNERYRSILRSLCLLKLRYEDVEKMMNLSNASIRKLKSKAIEEFKRVNNIE